MGYWLINLINAQKINTSILWIQSNFTPSCGGITLKYIRLTLRGARIKLAYSHRNLIIFLKKVKLKANVITWYWFEIEPQSNKGPWERCNLKPINNLRRLTVRASATDSSWKMSQSKRSLATWRKAKLWDAWKSNVPRTGETKAENAAWFSVRSNLYNGSKSPSPSSISLPGDAAWSLAVTSKWKSWNREMRVPHKLRWSGYRRHICWNHKAHTILANPASWSATLFQ